MSNLRTSISVCEGLSATTNIMYCRMMFNRILTRGRVSNIRTSISICEGLSATTNIMYCCVQQNPDPGESVKPPYIYINVLTMNKHICLQFIQMLVINTLTRMPCFLQLVVWPAMSSVLPPGECIEKKEHTFLNKHCNRTDVTVLTFFWDKINC